MERLKLAIERARAEAGTVQVSPHWTPREAELPPLPLETANDGALVELLPLDPYHLEQHRIVGLHQGNPMRQSFDLLRTQVLQRMQEHGWRTIAVTSPSMQSGKTVVSINLALSIAHHPSKSALLVDFDLRRPRVASYLGLPAGNSLNEVLAGDMDVNGAIIHAGIPGFQVLPTQRRVEGAGDVLASDRVSRIIGSLRSGSPDRVIVIDLPPVNAVDDVLTILPRVDCVLVVVGSGSSTRQEIEEAKRHLARFNVIGVVANMVPKSKVHESYY
jgi:capsular exopolysaccharide synthesis family protein